VPVPGRIVTWVVGAPTVTPISPPGSNEQGADHSFSLVTSFDPVWSPDGQWIAYQWTFDTFSRNPNPHSDDRSQIWIVHPDGTGARKVLGGNFWRTVWSPDGKYLYGAMYQDSQPGDVVRVELASGKVERIAPRE